MQVFEMFLNLNINFNALMLMFHITLPYDDDDILL